MDDNFLKLKAFGVNYVLENKHAEYAKQPPNCTLCNLCKTRKNIICGEIKPHKIAFLKLMPNEKENESGKCDKTDILKYFDFIDENDFYCGFLLRCYGKNTNFNCLKMCLPHLLYDLKSIDAKLLITLGDDVFYALGFKNYKLSLGKIFNFYNFSLIPSYNLDFLSKNPDSKSVFLDNIYIIKQCIQDTLQKYC